MDDYIKYGTVRYGSNRFHQRILKAVPQVVRRNVKYRLTTVGSTTTSIINTWTTIPGRVSRVRINGVISQAVTINGQIGPLRLRAVSNANESKAVLSTVNILTR